MTALRQTPIGVIFDMDGCLVDSEPLCLAAIADELQALGLKDITAKDIGQRFLGVSLASIEAFAAQHLGHAVPPGFKERIEETLIKAYAKDLRHIDGAEGLLNRLAAKGVTLGLATGASVRRMRATLEISGLADRFTGLAVSADEVSVGKPAPDIFLETATRMKLSPETCAVVEDSPHGVVGAVQAGMHALGFVGGTHLSGRKDQQSDLLRQAGAIQVFDTLDQLRAFILSGR